jgi:glycosyltransferase involved in cell wall biosynthesis
MIPQTLEQTYKTNPIVSIIIPCYNANLALTHCLKSCFYQTYPSIEIILVDNHSTDRSVTIAQSLILKTAIVSANAVGANKSSLSTQPKNCHFVIEIAAFSAAVMP